MAEKILEDAAQGSGDPSGEVPVDAAKAAGTRYRVAYLVTHPIQYQAPLLRLIAGQPDIALTVFYQSDVSLRSYRDAGFGRSIDWDVPLLGGYEHEFLPGVYRHEAITAQRPISWGFARRLRRTRFDALWVHGYSRWVNWVAIACAKARGLKVFVRDEATSDSAQRSALRQRAKRLFFFVFGQFVDGFLAIGSDNRDYFVSQGIRPTQIFMMPYCVDNDFFAARARAAAPARAELRASLGLEAGRPIILFASKFEPRKRPRDLLAAYQLLLKKSTGRPMPYLLFAGDGELRSSIESEARSADLEGVRFLGFRNQTELPALYDLCDVFVLPSVDEPWGLVINEVMAVGRPIVASDRVGCARDLVQDGVHGMKFRAGDVSALADALGYILADPVRAAVMGTASRDIIADWSFNEDVAGLRTALEKVVGSDAVLR
jgi:glycosyltransferase involved in cell wall biosynthesis